MAIFIIKEKEISEVTFKVEEDSFGDYECTITEITKI